MYMIAGYCCGFLELPKAGIMGLVIRATQKKSSYLRGIVTLSGFSLTFEVEGHWLVSRQVCTL